MNKRVEQLLRKIGVYAPMKSSLLYEAYLQVLRRDVLQERTREIEFYRSILRTSDAQGAIFDVGANLGDKAEVFRRVQNRVVCFEPDRMNIEFLKQRFRKHSAVVVVGKAVSDAAGTLEFNVFRDGDSLNTVSAKWVDVLEGEQDPRFGKGRRVASHYPVEAVTLDEGLDHYGPALYVKIDVEGHELNVLKGLTRPVPFLSFEVNLPHFLAEALECVAHIVSIFPAALFNYDVHCQFEMPQWMGAASFSAWLKEASIPYAEVWARMP